MNIKRVKLYRTEPSKPKTLLGNSTLDICLELIRLYYHDCIGRYGKRQVRLNSDNTFDVYSRGGTHLYSFYIDEAAQ